MQGRVAEHRVELALEWQRLSRQDTRVKSARTRSRDLRRTAVDTDNDATRLDQALREHTIAAAQVKNSLTRLRTEQCQHIRAQGRDEARVLRVDLRIPLLAGHNRNLPYVCFEHTRTSAIRLDGLLVALWVLDGEPVIRIPEGLEAKLLVETVRIPRGKEKDA
jgi:hypothetical protein